MRGGTTKVVKEKIYRIQTRKDKEQSEREAERGTKGYGAEAGSSEGYCGE